MSNWPTVPLSSIASIQMGQSPPGDTYNTSGDGLPFFQGKAEFGEDFPTRVKWCSQPNRIAEKSDILLSVRAPVGPTNIAVEKCCIGRGLASIRTNPKQCNQRYLRWYFRRFETEIASRGVGSTFFAINRNDIERLQLTLPPLLEQERIVKLLDEADALRKLRNQAGKRGAELIPALFEEMFGDPARNPKHWPTQRLRDISCKFSDGPFGSNLKSSHYVENGVRVIRLQNIGVGRLIDKDKAFISHEHFSTLRKHECLPGDVIVGTLGDPNLRAFTLDSSIAKSLNKADCVQIRPDPAISTAEYICWLLNLPSTLSMASGLIAGQTRSRISMGRLAELIVPVPKLPLQEEFAARVFEIRAMESQQSDSRRNLDALFQSMLHRAFQGEI